MDLAAIRTRACQTEGRHELKEWVADGEAERADCFSGEGFTVWDHFALHNIQIASKEHEESSMVSTISAQGQDCGPIAYNCRGSRRRMRLVRELGESEWDNG